MAKKRIRHPVKKRVHSKINKTLDKLKKDQEDRDALRKELQRIANKALKEEFQTYDETFKAMLNEHRVMKKLVMERLGVSLDEFNSRYKELKEKK